MEIIRKLTTKEIYHNNQLRSVPDGFNQMRVIMHNIRSMHNIGSVFRSADAFGISELILTGYTPHPPRPEISKTAIGAEKTVLWRHFPSFLTVWKVLKEQNYTFIGIEQTSASKSLIDYQLNTTNPICLVFGNEVTGIDNDIIEFIDEFLEIPQFGEKHSLNVSVTAGIVLYSFLEKYFHK